MCDRFQNPIHLNERPNDSKKVQRAQETLQYTYDTLHSPLASHCGAVLYSGVWFTPGGRQRRIRQVFRVWLFCLALAFAHMLPHPMLPQSVFDTMRSHAMLPHDMLHHTLLPFAILSHAVLLSGLYSVLSAT
jgi:hypothetical protein